MRLRRVPSRWRRSRSRPCLAGGRGDNERVTRSAQRPCGRCGSTAYDRSKTRDGRIVRCTDCHGRCDGCGYETLKIPFEWYTVHDAVWAAAGLRTHDAVLCVGCLEERLGRRLTPDDFRAVPINRLDQHMSDRLLDRMGLVKVWIDDGGNVIDPPP